MRARLVAGLALAIVWAAACGPSAPPAPSGSGTGQAAPGGAAPGGATAAQAATAWDAIVAAARQEGRLNVMGPQGNETRDALTLGFQQKYPDVQVDYQSLAGSPLAAKLLSEQAAGQALTDLIVVGTTTIVESLLPADALAPLPPYLTGPNDSDPSLWRGGKLDFADAAGQYSLVFSDYVKPPFVYNPNLVSP